MIVRQGRWPAHLLGRIDPRNALRAAIALVTPTLLVFGAHAVIPESIPSPARRTVQRVADLTDLRNAIEAYRTDRGQYPKSPEGRWAGLHSAWGLATPNWIPDLAPRYVAALPREPRKDANGANQYTYKSDGTDFKLLVFYPEQDCEAIAKLRPDLLDPIRGGGGPFPCHAYGYWSPGAAAW